MTERERFDTLILSDDNWPFSFSREEALNALPKKPEHNPRPPKLSEIEAWEHKTASRRESDRRRRAKKQEGVWEKYTEADVLEKWGKCCHLCGEEVDLDAPRLVGKIGWERGLHLEHVVDLALGGSDTLDNIKPSHGKCNLRKPRG